MRILVLGGEGMLGHKMYQTLLARYPDTACTILGSRGGPFYRKIDLFRQGRVLDEVDAMHLSTLDRRLAPLKPRFLVNCIGVIKQREESKAAIPSITLNSLLPHQLAEFARGWGGRVIHFSTDCVFSGKRGSYTEDDPSDAEDLYGKSKFLGEVAAENALTLRTSIIGRELAHFRSLLEWFLAERGGSVRGFSRVIFSGVTTNYLTRVVADLIEDFPELSGLYQVAAPSVTKYELLCMLRDVYRLDVDIVPDEREISDRSMIADRFLQTTGYPGPAWPDLMAELAADPTPYEKWR